MNIFKLPDLGEGLPEAEIVEWFIKEGDAVKVDQIIVAMETAKAIVDIPSPQAGKIARLYGAQGDIIHTGDPLLEFEQSEQANSATAAVKSTSVVGDIPTTKKPLKEVASGRQWRLAHRSESDARGAGTGQTPRGRPECSHPLGTRRHY